MELLVTYILLALCVSFLCSIMEATLLSITPSYLEQATTGNSRTGRRLGALKHDVGRPLSAILILNTIANTMGAAGAGAEFARLFGSAFEGVFMGCLTFGILVGSEIIPKTLGARYWRTLAPTVAHVLHYLIRILRPLIWMSDHITRLLNRNAPDQTGVTREELLTVAQMSRRAGSIREHDSRVLENLLSLREMKVSDIMTPHVVVFTLPGSTLVRKFPAIISGRAFSRIPLYGASRDEVDGFVLRVDVLEALVKDPHTNLTLADLRRPIPIVTETATVESVIHDFLTNNKQIGIVIDEFGTTVGLVTMEDLVETVLGLEIVDEKDLVADMRVLARQMWERRAKAMGIEVPDEEPS